jgi:hypothetical protein
MASVWDSGSSTRTALDCSLSGGRVLTTTTTRRVRCGVGGWMTDPLCGKINLLVELSWILTIGINVQVFSYLYLKNSKYLSDSQKKKTLLATIYNNTIIYFYNVGQGL